MRRCLTALLLIAVLMTSCMPFTRARAETGVIHKEELDTLFDDYVRDNGLNPDMISVAYCYTGTEETWYHQEDKWYYSASLYKVPLMMLLAEREYSGELTEDSMINALPLRTVEEEVLTNSNNELAYSVLLSFGQPDAARRRFCSYSDLPEEYYSWDFFGSSYFTARFMQDVMQTLYFSPERFPRVIDCLKCAQPDHYFRLKLGDRYEIAQKYGSNTDEDGSEWNHTAGIVYTPTPFLLTVMTRYGGISETILGDLALLFCDYTLVADERQKAMTTSQTAADVQEGAFEDDELLPDADLTETEEAEQGQAPYERETSETPRTEVLPAEHVTGADAEERITAVSPDEAALKKTENETAGKNPKRSSLILVCLLVEAVLIMMLIRRRHKSSSERKPGQKKPRQGRS